MCTEKFEKLLKAKMISPEKVLTEKIIKSNGKITLLKKGDGTYCLMDEFSGKQCGHFHTKEEAYESWIDLAKDNVDME